MREGRFRQLYQILYRAFHVALLFCMCLVGFGEWMGIQDVSVRKVFFAIMLLCGLLGISYCPARGKAACGIFILLFCWLIPVAVGAGQIGNFWTDYGDWLTGGSSWESTWVAGYELVQSCIIMSGCYFFQVLSEKIPLLRDGLAVLLFANFLICMFMRRSLGHIAVAFIWCYIILCLIERTEQHWKKQKGNHQREYILRVLPFCLLYLILMCLMPAPEEPFDWKFVKEAYAGIRENLTIWMQDLNRNGQEDFAVARKGFSETGKLMSGLIDDDRELLTIQGSDGLRTNVYLVGKVYDTFDGREWTQTVTTDNKEQMLDTLETLYAIKRYDGEWMEDYVFSTGLTVRYEYINTGCVFVPLKLQSLWNCEYQSSGANLIFGEQKGYGTEYKLTYFQLNVDHPRFYQMAETQLEDDDVLWGEVIRNYALWAKGNVSLEDLKQYRSSIMQNYDREIVLSQETFDYLAQITEGKETAIQKLQAIEKELSAMTYSEHPGKLPDAIESETDFLDYFLLESREGYCAYFATAFVLLARAEGIPARYVEGFCVPLNSGKKMTVTSGMAHAWPEVYLEGIGWIPFEPTPGYAEIRYTPWKLKSEAASSILLEAEDYEEEIAQAEPEERLQEEETQEISEEEDGRIFYLFVLVAAVILAGCLLLLVIDRLLFRRKYKRMTQEERFMVEVRRSLWLLSRLGFRRKDEETISELQQQVLAGMEEQKLSLDFLTFYEEYRYGNREITENILQITKEEQKALLLWMKQKNKWHYYFLLLRFFIAELSV